MDLTICGVRKIRDRRAFAEARRRVAILAIKNNEKRKWIRLADGKVFELTRLELAEMFGVPLARTSYLLNENSRNKIAKGFALYGDDYISDCVDKKIYSLVRLLDGAEFQVTRKQMFEGLKLTRGHVNGLVYGNTKLSGGYYRKDLWDIYDMEIPRSYGKANVVQTFINKSGEVFVCTERQLREKFSLSRKQVERLRQGLPTTADKLRIITSESFVGTTS